VRGVPLTPEQRAQRQSARRALARRVALRSALGVAALVVVLAIAAWWLLSTIGGRNVLLQQIVARLPTGTTLTWQRAEGPASGPLTLHGVRFTMPRQRDAACVAASNHRCDMGTLVFTAQAVVLDPALRPLLGRTLRLDALAISQATLELPETTKPFELPRWPDSLPQIAPPLALQARAIRVTHLVVTREHAPLVVINDARGGIEAANGRLHIEHLLVDSDRGRFAAHGDYVPADDYRTDLVATAVLPAPPHGTAPALGLVARGDLSAMTLALAGNAPAPLRATLALHGKDVPRWNFSAQSTALDPALLVSATHSTPIAFALRADGSGGHASVRGRVTRGALSAVIRPSQLALADQVLDAQPLVVDTLDGRITLRGRADLRDPAHSSLRFAANARGLSWSAVGAAPIRADADLGIAGTLDAWAAIGNASLRREGQVARLRFDSRGTPDQLVLRSLHVATPGGALDATGDVRWTPALRWDLNARLAAFDPGYFAPGWNGAIDGTLTSTGSTLAGGGYGARVEAPRLQGRLRGRALRGHGQLAVHGAEWSGEVALALGGSRIDAHGTLADTLAVDARFAPLQLADLLPQASGVLRGTLQLRGMRNAPDIDVDLSGRDLAYAGRHVDAVDARGRLPWARGNGALTLDARGIDVGIALEQLHLQAQGATQALQLQGNAHAGIGALAFAGNAAHRNSGWSGVLDMLRATPAHGSAWRLQAPARFAQDGARWTLARSCLTSEGAGAICASADWPRHGVDLDAHGLPLALSTPYLPPRSDGRPWLLHGTLDGVAALRPAGRDWRATLRVESASGGLRNSDRSRHDLVGYDHLLLEAILDPRRVDARLGSGLMGNGHIDAHVDTGWDAYAPLHGELAFSTDALTWMELLSPDIVEPTGHLEGHVTLAGTRAQPALGGQAQLSRFNTDVPALAITLEDGSLRLDARADGSARVQGSVRSGQGTLAIDGSLGWRDPTTAPLVLNVHGRNVLASDTSQLHAVVDPDVVVRYAAGQPLSVSGRVGVPSATLDLARLDQGATTSPDVVVLDPVDPQRGVATPLALDLTLALGKDVRLHGFGLDGTLAGELRVRAQPERTMLATGALEVGGRYLAYGQKLDITRGRLLWSNSPIGDPMLDIRAQRDVGDVTAGIDVSGRATQPQAQVWTDPATDQSQALAYLALGRPLSTASNDETRQLDAAGAALSAGGNLLASQLGAKLGLDNAGVSDSRALGGSVLGVGKFLSPRLYVGYGVSLLGTGQVLTLKYLLRKGFDIEIESSTVENRASANWRKEK